MIPAHLQNPDSPQPLGRTSTRWTDLLFAGLLAASCFVSAWFTGRGTNGDAISYYDLSDAVRQHAWHATVNASWFPLYPALLTLSRALFHFEPRFDGAAARLLNGVVGFAFVGSAATVAVCLRNLAIRDHPETERLPGRTVSAVVATVGYLVWSVDVAGTKPDALLAMLVLLAIASLAQGLYSLRWAPFLLAGALAGAAYWTKAFAFPLMCLVFLFAAVATLANRAALLRVLAASAVFALVVAPYIGLLSAAKHRFTIGDAGRLNSAWFVNGANRFNPVDDPSMDSRGLAAGHFLHPAVLIARMPEIAFYGNSRVFGHMPAWDDFSFWSDGLSSRPVLHQYAQAVATNLKGLLAFVAMRLQLLLLVLAPLAFGFAPQRVRGEPGRLLFAFAAATLAAIVLYILVHFEPRYVLFAAVLLPAAFLPLLVRTKRASSSAVPHAAVLLLCTMICITDLQEVLRTGKIADAQTGNLPAQALFDAADFRAGLALRERVPPGSQVACLGLDACYGDALWSWYAGDRITAVVTLPQSMETSATEQICRVLGQHPEAAAAMLTHDIHGVVAWFYGPPQCGPGWQPLVGPNGYYYLPIA